MGRLPPLSDRARQLIRDGLRAPPSYPPLSAYPAPVRVAVEAFDEARIAMNPLYAGQPMTDAGKEAIAPLIAAALAAAIDAKKAAA